MQLGFPGCCEETSSRWLAPDLAVMLASIDMGVRQAARSPAGIGRSLFRSVPCRVATTHLQLRRLFRPVQ
jgi:hypothetical protein